MFNEDKKLLLKSLNNLTNIDYKEISTKNIIEIHKYNLNLQEETYNNFISYLNTFLNEIKQTENINNYYEELHSITITKHKVPTLKELNISNYISLRSINLNKKLTKEINNFYNEINKILNKIQEKINEKEKINNEIINLNEQIKKLNNQKYDKTNKIINEKTRIKEEISSATEKLNNTFILNIFKKDYLKSQIDLLNQEYKEYEQSIKNLNKYYKEEINKLNLKINELKNTLK